MDASSISVVIISMSVILTSLALIFKKVNKCNVCCAKCTQDVEKVEKVADTPEVKGLFNILLGSLTPRKRQIAIEVVKDASIVEQAINATLTSSSPPPPPKPEEKKPENIV